MAFSLSRKTKDGDTQNLPLAPLIFPVVALRQGVVMPNTDALLTFGRSKSNAAIEAAFKNNRQIVFVAQKKAIANPTKADLYSVGTLAYIENVMPSSGELLVLVKAQSRVNIVELVNEEPFFQAVIQHLPDEVKPSEKLLALAKQVSSELKKAFDLGKPVEFPVFMKLISGVSAVELSNQVANILDVKTAIKQDILQTNSIEDRLQKVLIHLVKEIKELELERSISSKTHEKYDKNVKEHMLRERKKTIEQELEDMGAESAGEYAELKKKLKSAGMPKDVSDKAEKEFSRLSSMNSSNPESSYLRSYLEWLADMPWNKYVAEDVSLDKASGILETDHYGLPKAKERILEYLAVLKLKEAISKKTKDQKHSTPAILCLVGAPGVGKTSIGRSIAKSLGRKFVRVSLGGVRDEAEIRGHRRTYVGALPGRIIQGIKNAGSKNPVFMLDEIDKLASDYRGDPAAALLEALDPEQNKEFSDHYLEVPFDLSDVIFIATANMLDPIPAALRDRMEIIEFPGYTIDEKVHIAKKHLWAKQLEANGLSAKVMISDEAIKLVATRYTREAGVRELERKLAQICRKIAKDIVKSKKQVKLVTEKMITNYLGPYRFAETAAEKLPEIGISTGMAWTQAGGDILFIEVAVMPGRGDLKITGQLGDVMKESAAAAYSYVRSRWQELGLKEDFYKKIDIHIHVPEGAVPKDGPSAGVAMSTALVSALTKVPVKSTVSMTGEITLRGRVMEIGGVKEKVIAAHRSGIRTIILPKDNEKDLIDVPQKIKDDIKFVFASHLDTVLDTALISYKTGSILPKPIAIA